MISPIAPKKDETMDISQNMLSDVKQGKQVKTTTVKTYQKGPVKVTETWTTYEVWTSPKKKIGKTKSPTKRLMDMKNSSEKAQIKTHHKKDDNKILYNVTPGQAYLVTKEDFGKMTEEQF